MVTHSYTYTKTHTHRYAKVDPSMNSVITGTKELLFCMPIVKTAINEIHVHLLFMYSAMYLIVCQVE